MVIEIKDICKSFRVEKENFVALDHVSFSFHSGMIYGLTGRNGSGKTMLLKAILGLIRTDSGKILFDGEELERPESAGAIIENPGFLPEYTGFKNLKLLSMLTGKVDNEGIRKAILKCGLDPDNRKKVSAYSMGMRQRLGLAQAIMEDPEILLLDEPFSGLDEKGLQEMYELFDELRSRGKLIIIASHSKEDIETLCDTVLHMQSGRLELTEKPEMI